MAVGLAGALWLHQALIVPEPTVKALLERTIFLTVAAYILVELGRGALGALGALHRRGAATPAASAGVRAITPAGQLRLTRGRLAWAGVFALLVLAQTVAHLDDRGGYLYMTRPGFPTGAGTQADGYVTWIEGHPTYEESWQFGKQAALYTGASEDRSTGDHDARAAHAYLAALLARPLGYFGAFISLNVVFWYAGVLATWYLAARLLGDQRLAIGAALLTATGQGFVFMSTTAMSYVAGYTWGVLLLALAERWRLFGRQSDLRRWLIWGWLCGVSGLFYFTHVVLVGVAWVFGARRVPLHHLVAATTLAFFVPAAWYAIGHHVAGLEFKATTAGDLMGELRRLVQLAIDRPLLLPSEAGSGSQRAFIGGFYYPVLALAAVGAWRAAPRRRQWYLAVALCGFLPALILHMIPATQRYGYLSFPAIHLAAVEGAAWLASQAHRWFGSSSPVTPAVSTVATIPRPLPATWAWTTVAALTALQLFQGNADLFGIYRFTIAFGSP